MRRGLDHEQKMRWWSGKKKKARNTGVAYQLEIISSTDILHTHALIKVVAQKGSRALRDRGGSSCSLLVGEFLSRVGMFLIKTNHELGVFSSGGGGCTARE